MPLKKMNLVPSKAETLPEEKLSLLELPELPLECILKKLSPAGLCSMAGVCSSLRDRCTSDHLWKRHMEQKWGKLIGDAAYREWQWHVVSNKRASLQKQTKQKGFFTSLYNLLPFSWNRPKMEKNCEPRSSLPADSIMAWYVSLESGKFWFSAQVYNRENGHAGFLLSCYDAELSYDSRTNTFRARYTNLGRRTNEENISWNRLRAPPTDTPSNVLHISDCLDDLKPGDHIEIQWRRNKEFPYGWWYGVVGHLESCDRNGNHCHCHCSDMMVLEFNQYPAGSQWRQTMINRREHREVGNEINGFYGGIRKLYKEEEIAIWKSFWTAHALD
ncbi:F-box protein At2g32560-like [Mangifera indica]|uniref:F-box protein At2g32560-like n=1 Tax=Mangifera indica TaxID=29780 RepID=UPI001CF9BA28|nr:F-box protein At2g32560-like [Mangifera indica]